MTDHLDEPPMTPLEGLAGIGAIGIASGGPAGVARAEPRMPMVPLGASMFDVDPYRRERMTRHEPTANCDRRGEHGLSECGDEKGRQAPASSAA